MQTISDVLKSMLIILNAMDKLDIEYVHETSFSDVNKFFDIYQHSDVVCRNVFHYFL